MDQIEKLIDLHQSLMQVSHGEGYVERSRFNKLSRIISSCADKLDTSRVSVWLLDETRTSIRCEALYLRSENRYEAGVELHARDFPAYFAALNQDRIINADDARLDPRTSEFAESYLTPLDIFSMLDAPIFTAGGLSGVLCIENTGATRQWDVAEVSYAAAVADTISAINEQELWHEARQQSEFLQHHDSLTGLCNHYYFQQRIEHELQRDPTSQRALVLLGLDGFGSVNDKYGQHQANQVLMTLAERFQQIGVPGLLVARLNGDNFGFWLHTPSGSEPFELLLDGIEEALDEPVETEEGTSISISGTLGVFNYPFEGEGNPNPVNGAEIAMKTAKKNQPGSIGYFSASSYQRLHEKQRQKDEFLRAIDEKQLRAYYQPIHNSQSHNGKLGMEALVRWQHPERGLIPPGLFLPLANELELMKHIGEFMLNQVCEDMCLLRQQGQHPHWASVNLCAEHIYSPSLLTDIESLLDRYDLPGHCLEMEIVEEVIGQSSSLLMSQLRGLAELGISLSIDDFGTGYSSLSRLKHLPVRKLKIDKSFVDGLPNSINDISITRSIIGLAKAMQLELVAEGVETAAQADWLRNESIDYLQGYHFAKPMPLESLIEYINKMG